MAFKLDKENTGFKTIEPGEYEVYPHVFAKEVAKGSGNKIAQFNYIIRDDVDQDSQGQEIRFDNFVETPNALWRVNQASEAAGIDMDAEFDSIYDWAEMFVNKAVRVEVGMREYNGKTFPEVRSFLPSKYGGEYAGKADAGKPAANDPFKNNGEPVDIDDDDLPF